MAREINGVQVAVPANDALLPLDRAVLSPRGAFNRESGGAWRGMQQAGYRPAQHDRTNGFVRTCDVHSTSPLQLIVDRFLLEDGRVEHLAELARQVGALEDEWVLVCRAQSNDALNL